MSTLDQVLADPGDRVKRLAESVLECNAVPEAA
jgi:hypothetical protein